MKRATLSNDRPVYHKAAIMAWAYREGRFAFRMCRNVNERRAQLSHWLRKAWAAAKAEAYELRRSEDRAAAVAAFQAQAAQERRALAAQFGNRAAAIRQEIEREHYRQHFNGARIDALRGALASIGA